MMRILEKNKLCQLVVVAAAVVALAGADAMAYSYGSWGSGGSYGGGGYGSGGSYGSAGRVGLRGRMAARRASRRASRASYGSYGSAGSYGGYGASSYGGVSYGGSYASVSYSAPAVSYVSSYVSAPAVSYSSPVSYGSTGSTSYSSPVYSAPVEYSSPVEYGTPVDAGCSSCTGSVSTDREMLASGSASIAVSLPANAKVYVNGSLTTSVGGSRSYVSNGLEAGRAYAYKLRVEFEQNGETIVKHETIKLRAGSKVSLAFGNVSDELQLAAADGPAKTELKIRVPENAGVMLAGSETKQTGVERTFTTHLLTEGQEWAGYTIRVVLERDGKELVQERTLKIEGGQTYELAFDFDPSEGVQVAQLNK